MSESSDHADAEAEGGLENDVRCEIEKRQNIVVQKK